MPQKGLEGRLAISRRYMSGVKLAWEAVFRPNVTRQEKREGKTGRKVPHRPPGKVTEVPE